MKEKLILFTMIFSLTVNAAALVTMGYFWGRDYTGSEYRFEGEKPPSLTADLSLNTRQRGKMRGLRRALLQETTPIQDRLLVKRGELANHLQAHVPDRPAIDRTLGEINELQLQMQLAVVDNLIKEKAFLEPEQQKQYATRLCTQLCQGSCSMAQGGGDCRCAPGGEGRRGMGTGFGRGDGRGKRDGWGRRDGRGRWQ